MDFIGTFSESLKQYYPRDIMQITKASHICNFKFLTATLKQIKIDTINFNVLFNQINSMCFNM